MGKAGGGTIQDSIDATEDHIDAVNAMSLAGYPTAADAVTANPLGMIDVPNGTYSIADVQLSGTGLRGRGLASILQASGTTSVLRLGYVNSPSQWAKKRISDLAISGNSKASDGVTFSAASSPQLSGRWVLDGLNISGCKKAINKTTGNIGNALIDSNISGNDYGYFAVGQNSPLMHAGADSIQRVHFEYNAKAAIYIDSNQLGTGGTAIRDTIIENNAGFGIFVKNWRAAFTPLTLDNVWFEVNATAGTVNVEGVDYTPKDVYLENAAHVVIKNSVIPKMQLVGSNVAISDSNLTADTTTWDIDSGSTVIVERASLDGGLHPVCINSIVRTNRALGNFAARFYAPQRREKTWDTSNVITAESYAGAATYNFTGTAVVQAAKVADGLVFDSCAELVVPASHTELGTLFSVTSGKWYVMTLDIKHMSGLLSDLTFNVVNSGTFVAGLRPLLKTGKWVTLAAIGQASASFNARLSFANGATGSQTLRLSAYQVVEFDTAAEAVDYYNAGLLKVGTSLPRVIYQDAIPTVGTWAVGDRCIRRTPVVGQPKSWACTVSGTPGTWVSEGNL